VAGCILNFHGRNPSAQSLIEIVEEITPVEAPAPNRTEPALKPVKTPGIPPPLPDKGKMNSYTPPRIFPTKLYSSFKPWWLNQKGSTGQYSLVKGFFKSHKRPLGHSKIISPNN